jgi:hypothetical protein
MAIPAYIELKKPSLEDPARLSILKSRYNRIAVRLNGFFEILSKEEVDASLIQLKYFEQQIKTYEKF